MLLLLLTTLQAFAGDTRCNIPVQVKTYDVDPTFYETYSRRVLDAINDWNAAETGFYFYVTNWNSPTDSNDHYVTVSMGALDPTKLGTTWSRAGQDSMIDRIKIILSSTGNFCRSDDQNDCYDVKRAMLHELGHSVGLQHSSVPDSMMWYGIRYRNETVDKIPAVDVESARQLFKDKGCTTAHGGLEWGEAL